jgi:hypothetical protein
MYRLFKRRSPWAALVAALIAILVIGATLAVIGIIESPKGKRDDFWFELAKAGIQIAVISSAGAVVSALLTYIDERRTRNEQRLRVFHDIVLAYNEIKAVRRNLRVLGMRTRRGSLNAEQEKEIREQFRTFNRAQLSLEAIKRELNESNLFKDSMEIVCQLAAAEQWLSDVHERWENKAKAFGKALSQDHTQALPSFPVPGFRYAGVRVGVKAAAGCPVACRS